VPEFWSLKGHTFSLLHIVQTGSGAHPASCAIVTADFSEVNRFRRETDHPAPASAEVNRTWVSPIRLHGVMLVA
jgi:hypothetical protein